MNLIDRYLHEVGRYLPGKNKEDILAELRSHLSDTLEERFNGQATEEDLIALLKETGEPRKVAASYPGVQQYLIGPDLYPFFQMVAGIVLAAVIGAQLLAVGISALAGETTFAKWETWAGLLTSIPSALGAVVIVFMILKRFGVQPDLKEGEWNPLSLPRIEEDEEIKKGERIFSIIGACVFLAVLAAIPEKIGIYQFPGGIFYPDPVIMQNIGWMMLVLLAGIGMDVFLLWQGRWTLGSRIARIAVNFLEIGVLIVLLQGHTAWLSVHGSNGFFTSLAKWSEDVTSNFQVLGMEIFRMVFAIVLIVTIVETFFMLFRMVRGVFAKKVVPVELSK